MPRSLPVVAEFRPGDPVPEWLLAQSPDAPDAERATMVFVTATLVVDHAGSYLLLPACGVSDRPFIEAINGRDITLSAEGRPILMPIQWQKVGKPNLVDPAE